MNTPLPRLFRNATLTTGAFIFLTYAFRRWIFAYQLNLTPPAYGVRVERNLRVPTRDGLTLATDHYAPKKEGSYPAILMRCPYGRNWNCSVFGGLLEFFAQRFAERGYHVLVQDVRGRFDSDGQFEPYFHEQNDGLDTIAWLRQQAWFNGKVGLWGPSYLGITQWAIAAHAPEIKALTPTVTGAYLHTVLYPDGVLDLGLAMRWITLLRALDEKRDQFLLAGINVLREVEKNITPAFTELPITNLDELVLEEDIAYYRQWLEHPDVFDALWQEAMQQVQIDQVSAPVHLIGGWYDFFLRALLSDYRTLREVGKRPYLTIGPWHHFSNSMLMLDSLGEGLRWFDAQLKGEKDRLREKPVRIFVMGQDEWREMEDFPPPSKATPYFLHPDGYLGLKPVELEDSSSQYHYDPSDPTPAVGGAYFSLWAGAHDNRQLESRPDVLTFTGDVLENPVEVIGYVRLELYVKSSLEHTDFFGRLCDVHPDGKSINICDGLFHVEPGKQMQDGSRLIIIDMWATAYRFLSGHRLRLQVSSGAHPHWSRNLGTGDPFGTEMQAADQTIFHDCAHPSALVLPITL